MKVAIAGYGVEGEENYLYYSKQPGNDITIVDESDNPDKPLPGGVKSILGAGAFEKLEGFDLVVRTAGLNPDKIKTDGKIWSATNEFFEKCPAKIIGVTGSKGKGTTASLIASVLRAAGKDVWLVGNIGEPALRILSQVKPSDIVVYELSSFQLWDLQKSPSMAVVVYMESEHLDRHRDVEDYVEAKANITINQKPEDILIYLSGNQYVETIADTSKAQKIAYPDEESAHVRDGKFYYGEQELFATSSLRLVGDHNQQNACAAIDAVWELGVQDGAVIAKGVANFSGLDHRLKLVGEKNGVKYFDDSISTTPGSSIAALKSFERGTIVLGGSSKGADFGDLAKLLAHSQFKATLIGEEAERIKDQLDSVNFDDYEMMPNASMQEVVEAISKNSRPGDSAILSPGCASFDQFRDYKDRGDQFISAVESLN